jgi:hypothetical protein
MEYTLRLGEWMVLGRGWLKRNRMMFAGEPSPGVFSVALEWTYAHNSAASNIYFHKSQREFPAFNGRVAVLDVTKHELRFRFDRGAAGG